MVFRTVGRGDEPGALQSRDQRGDGGFGPWPDPTERCHCAVPDGAAFIVEGGDQRGNDRRIRRPEPGECGRGCDSHSLTCVA